MIYIGIDPGVSGGIAAIDFDGCVVSAIKMPGTERDVLDVFMGLRSRLAAEPATGLAPERHVKAVLERVNAGVFGGAKMGQRMGVTSAFTFGCGVGALRMALTAAMIPFNEVSPLSWQSNLQCRTKGDKNVSKRRAQQLFPNIKITHATADALLIAEYCRRLHTWPAGKLLAAAPDTSPEQMERDNERHGKAKGKGRGQKARRVEEF